MRAKKEDPARCGVIFLVHLSARDYGVLLTSTRMKVVVWVFGMGRVISSYPVTISETVENVASDVVQDPDRSVVVFSVYVREGSSLRFR